MEARKLAFTPVWGYPLLLSALVSAGGPLASGQTESVLYTFQGQPGNDGYYPEITPLASTRPAISTAQQPMAEAAHALRNPTPAAE